MNFSKLAEITGGLLYVELLIIFLSILNIIGWTISSKRNKNITARKVSIILMIVFIIITSYTVGHILGEYDFLISYNL